MQNHAPPPPYNPGPAYAGAAPPSMFGAQVGDPLAGAATVGLDSRLPLLTLGDHEVTIESIRYHDGFKGPGVMVEVREADGRVAGWRIMLGGKFPHYGIRDTKILHAAVQGWAKEDPRALAADTPQLRAMMADPCPHKGRKIMVNVTEDQKPDKATGRVKIDPETGRPYLRIFPRACGTSAAAPAPVAPAQPAGPPEGWYAFPAGDPRAGTHWYNAGGEIRPIAG